MSKAKYSILQNIEPGEVDEVVHLSGDTIILEEDVAASLGGKVSKLEDVSEEEAPEGEEASAEGGEAGPEGEGTQTPAEGGEAGPEEGGEGSESAE